MNNATLNAQEYQVERTSDIYNDGKIKISNITSVGKVTT